MKIRQSDDELNNHLNEQLILLESSIDSYDAGLIIEAKRMAVTIRLLFHETRNSHSLMKQLNMLDHKFLSTAVPNDPANFLSYAGLIGVVLFENKTSQCVPMLDEAQVKRWISFDEWWNEVIFRDLKNKGFSRKDIIISVANQDGGAHVDPSIEATFAELSRNNSLKWFIGFQDEYRPIVKPELPAIRQIAHEVWRTIFPYKAVRTPLIGSSEGVFISGVTANVGGIQPTKSVEKYKRNELCPCGSGVKFKKCHGHNFR
ncbi:SEC-C domain-containing protein [Cohnella ginsengisoli]|uniref:SEC-C domain-containing protein n=1 Tax=Cohnella ginsengisoli TaxID=425004 RepID=A0A9X4KG05_9BACL|nr:SEC-C domain-containing protein [Cohnella ginsengisoli]MDG0791442.1 SEC-C domain-containing protein [Cohnella ginsengisoli]